MGSNINRFVKGVITGWSYMVFSLAVNLWLVPFTLKYLSKPEYGIFAIATDLLSWLSLTSLGVGAVLNSKGAQLMGSGDKEELNIITSTTFYTQLASSLIILLVGIVITIRPGLVFSKEASTEYLQLVVAILVTGYTISFIFQPLNSLLISSKQIHIDNYLKFGLLIIKTILTVIFLTHGLKLLSIALGNFIATVIISLLAWIRVKATLGYIKVNLKLWRFDRFVFLIKNGIWFTIGGLAGIFILRMDSFLIGHYISLSMVTNFVITSKLYQISDTFHQQFFNTTRPYFAQVYGKNDMILLSKMHDLSYNLSFTAAFIIGVIVMVLNKWFVGIWVGPDYFISDTINCLLCINFILQASVLPNRIVLATTLFKIEWHNIIRISEGIFKLIIVILLIKHIGVVALIIASIIACLIFSSVALNYLSNNLLRGNFRNKIILLIFIAFIPVIFYLVKDKYLSILILSAISFLVLYQFWILEGGSLKKLFIKVSKSEVFKNKED